MKKISIAILYTGLFLAACGPIEALQETDAGAAMQDLVASDEFLEVVQLDDPEVFLLGLIPSEQTTLPGWDLATKYAIDLNLSTDATSLEGGVRAIYYNAETIPLEEIYFRLFPNIMSGHMTVSDLFVDGKPVEPTYELADSALVVPLEKPLQPGDAIGIEMSFNVDIPTEMSGNYGLFGSFDDITVLQEFYPLIPVYDDEGWNAEIPPEQGDVTYLDPSYYLVRVRAPAEMELVTSGTTLAESQEDDRKSIIFAAGPARDIYIAGSDRFKKVSENIGDVQVNSYAFDDLKPGSEQALEYAIDSIASFNQRFGQYPYSEFDLVSTPMMALGMEYPGVVAISQDLYDLDATLYGVPVPIYLESVVAHEVAHQWFYNVVGNDQVDEPWLDEAIVQFATGLYYLDQYGQQGYDGYRGSWQDRWNRVDRADIPIGMPVSFYEDQEYGAIVYGRGPLFMEALQRRMGESQFDDFLRDYYETYQWGVASPEGFRQLAEAHCECNLTELFDEWVY